LLPLYVYGFVFGPVLLRWHRQTDKTPCATKHYRRNSLPNEADMRICCSLGPLKTCISQGTIPFQNIFFFFKSLPPITLLPPNISPLLALNALNPHPHPTPTHTVHIITLHSGNLALPVQKTKLSTNNCSQFLFLRYTTCKNREQIELGARCNAVRIKCAEGFALLCRL